MTDKPSRELEKSAALAQADAISFRSLITGSIAGALMAARHLLIDVDVPTDEEGNYLPAVLVTGQESGSRLRVSVEILKDEP